MPPDTISLPAVSGPPAELLSRDTAVWDSLTWERSVQQHMDSLELIYYRDLQAEQPRQPGNEGLMFLFLFVVIALSAYFYIVHPDLKRRRANRVRTPRDPKEKAAADQRYDQWLSQYNPYYNALPGEHKKRFLERVHAFMDAKQFCFHAMVKEDYIPVLISGAAIQLTYGLRNYLMDYFDVIHIMRKEYVLNIDRETYYGHVSKNGIHISWSRFLEGYQDYTDAINVGIHEMAHALQFDSSLGNEDDHDRHFKARLQEFSEEGRPVFRAMRQGMSHLLDDYASLNFDEFWAVSVETFFENPVEFREKLPHLYQELCTLLNQDPAEPGKILDPSLA